ncbi:family 1 glycosylhydrolase [Ilumatobacter sp.]|uniref:family 1 glycosylhydrolase n=1 Tax=Ilumatobacter sp. TaxID=1967498 RepID=UPI003B51FDA8
MPFHRGATLPVAATLGHAESSTHGPTAGNGFYKRWPDDLALLSDVGVTDLRLTFDWARLQPKPGEFSGDWSERYENILEAADAVGIRVWATMHDEGVPKWFGNEGGLDDVDAVVRWWPRWVERVAERFGDDVHGWIPFAVVPGDLPSQAWTDTWQILGGGDSPVAISLQARDGFARVGELLDSCDVVGVALETLLDDEEIPDDAALTTASERWEQALHDAADAADGTALVVSQFTPHHVEPDVGGRIVDRFVTVVDSVVDDGIELTTCFLDPGIAGPEFPLGIIDRDRTPQPAADAYFVAPVVDEDD